MKLNKAKFDQNAVPLLKETKETIIDIIEEYYERIDSILHNLPTNEKTMQKSDKDYVDGHLLASYLLAIGEGYDFLIDKEHWLANAYNVLLYFKQHIEKYYHWSLFHGLSDFAFGLLDIQLKSGEFNKFLKSLNKYLCSMALEQNALFQKEVTLVHHYDVITGMAGVGRYLLLYIEQLSFEDDCLQEKTMLKQILKYFVNLSEDVDVNGKKIIGFYVANENLWPEKRRKQYLQGTLDFGVAHGIAGPLALMTYAAKQNIVVDGQIEAMNKIISIFNEHTAIKNDIIYWPMLLPAELYKQPNVADIGSRMSWCYGSIGISCVLYQVYKYLELNPTEYLRNMEQIAQAPWQVYNLFSPIVCHGFAGTMAMFNQIYKETLDKELLPGLYMCLDKVLNLHNPDFPYGFKNIDYDNEGRFEKEDDTYLNGSTGIILALLSLFNPSSLHEKHLLIS